MTHDQRDQFIDAAKAIGHFHGRLAGRYKLPADDGIKSYGSGQMLGEIAREAGLSSEMVSLAFRGVLLATYSAAFLAAHYEATNPVEVTS